MIRPRLIVLAVLAVSSYGAIVLVSLDLPFPFGRVQAAVAPDPAAIVRRLAEDLDLQTKLPGAASKPVEVTSDANLKIPGAQSILWVALAIVLVLVLFAVKDAIPGFSRRPKIKADVAAAQAQHAAAAERMVQTGDEADDLAAQGRIGEAMHLLLLRSLVELRRRLGITFADSLTSREILRRLTLPEAGREALADLIRRVEFAHFGAKPSTAEDYAACRDSYERLIGAMLDPIAVTATHGIPMLQASAA